MSFPQAPWGINNGPSSPNPFLSYPTLNTSNHQNSQLSSPSASTTTPQWYHRYTNWVAESKPVKVTMQHPYWVFGLLITFIVTMFIAYQYRQSQHAERERKAKKQIMIRAQRLLQQKEANAPIFHLIIIAPPDFVETQGEGIDPDQVDVNSKLAQTLCDLVQYAAQPHALRILVVSFDESANVAMTDEDDDTPRIRDVKRIYQHLCRQALIPCLLAPQLVFYQQPVDEWFGYYKAYTDGVQWIQKSLMSTTEPLSLMRFAVFVHRGFRPTHQYDHLLLSQWRAAYEQANPVKTNGNGKKHVDFMTRALKGQTQSLSSVYQWYHVYGETLVSQQHHMPVMTQPLPFEANVVQLKQGMSRSNLSAKKQLQQTLRTFDDYGDFFNYYKPSVGVTSKKTINYQQWRPHRDGDCWPGTFDTADMLITASATNRWNQSKFAPRPSAQTNQAYFFDVPSSQLRVHHDASTASPIHTPWLDTRFLFMPLQLLLDRQGPIIRLWRNAGNLSLIGHHPIHLMTTSYLWHYYQSVVVNPLVLLGVVDNVYATTTNTRPPQTSPLWHRTPPIDQLLPHTDQYIQQALGRLVSLSSVAEFERYYGLDGILTQWQQYETLPSESSLLGVCNPSKLTANYKTVVSAQAANDNFAHEVSYKYRHETRYKRQVRLIHRQLETLSPAPYLQQTENPTMTEQDENMLQKINDTYILVLGDD